MDFRSLDMQKYRPAPLWFLNHELEEAELIRQIRLMKQAGVSGFFIHPRAGLKTPYGSKRWFDMVRLIVEEASRLNLKAWLYDEDPFSGGVAGGRVVFDNPEYVARSLIIRTGRPGPDGEIVMGMGGGTVLSVLAVRRNQRSDAGEIIDLSDHVGILREHYFKTVWNSSYYATVIHIPLPHYRAETFYPEQVLKCRLDGDGWEVFAASVEVSRNDDKHGFAPDNLNADSVRHFIELTHEKYLRCCGDHFGGAVPGIFTDEPVAGGFLPWTGVLEQEFKERKGYALSENFFHLVAHYGQRSTEVREDYWEIVNSLFARNYFGQIHDWCREHGLLSVGHVCAEEDPVGQTMGGGSVFSYQRYFDVPGFDIITTRISDNEHPVLNFGGKLVSSAAHQQGKKTIMSECFACAPWNYGRDSMLKTTNWLYALGITWLVPHAFFYSIDGDRKCDAGKAYSFQDPYYHDLPWFADYAARMGALLSESRHVSNTVMLYPVSSFGGLLPARIDEAIALRNGLYDALQKLIQAHIEFDFVDEETLLASEIEDGELICGEERYRMVVIQFEDLLGRQGRASLDKLESSGVAVIHVDADGEFVDEVKRRGGVWTPIEPLRDTSRQEDLMVLMKECDGVRIIYVFNNSSNPGWFKFPERLGRYGCLFDARTGEYLRLSGADFAIEGFGSLVFLFSEDDIPVDRDYIVPDRLEETHLPAETSPQLDYIMPGDDVAPLIRWDITIESRAGTEIFSDRLCCLIRDLIGTELPHITSRQIRPVFDCAESVPSIYPVKATFTARFKVTDGRARHLLIFESETISGSAEAAINGVPLDLSAARRRLVYDPFNLVLEIGGIVREGENVMTITFCRAGEFDGLKSSVFVVPESSLSS